MTPRIGDLVIYEENTLTNNSHYGIITDTRYTARGLECDVIDLLHDICAEQAALKGTYLSRDLTVIEHEFYTIEVLMYFKYKEQEIKDRLEELSKTAKLLKTNLSKYKWIQSYTHLLQHFQISTK